MIFSVFRCFRDPNRVSRNRIRENYHRVPRIRENRVPRIREIRSLQVYTRCLTFYFEKIWYMDCHICRYISACWCIDWAPTHILIFVQLSRWLISIVYDAFCKTFFFLLCNGFAWLNDQVVIRSHCKMHWHIIWNSCWCFALIFIPFQDWLYIPRVHNLLVHYHMFIFMNDGCQWV